MTRSSLRFLASHRITLLDVDRAIANLLASFRRRTERIGEEKR